MSPFLYALFYSLFLCFTIISADKPKSFIVRVQNDMKPSSYSNLEDWYKSTLQTLPSYTPQAGQGGKDFIYVYKKVFHGFTTVLTTQQAQELKTRPGILGVMPDRLLQLHTTRTPQFLGLEGPKLKRLARESDWGSDVIIGMLDTGIWPERQSFSDHGLGPVPARWKGICQEGEKFTKDKCNKKIIGARYFTDGYEAMQAKITSLKSARDTIGHGTHTASTAAGRKVNNASLFGLAEGKAMGMAPKARLAIYKICWEFGCAGSDIIAGFDSAVEDGVDVISLSVGGAPQLYDQDEIAISSYGAMEHGVIVSASAGNSGPEKWSVSNMAPWLTSVGAGMIDRRFPGVIELGNGEILYGATLYVGDDLPYMPLIFGAKAAKNSSDSTILEEAEGCVNDALDMSKLQGKILVCRAGYVSSLAKEQTVIDAGGAGLIIFNVAPLEDDLISKAHLIPALTVPRRAGVKIQEYVKLVENPVASLAFLGTRVGVKPAPAVSFFSSRGPSKASPYLLKPDVIAPGHDILAAWPDHVPPTDLPSDKRNVKYNIISGTSMSCPHVSGLMALLKGAHPDWTPAMVRSALMTTTYTEDSDGNAFIDGHDIYSVTDIWDIGAGHVDVTAAFDPGLVYDTTVEDYLHHLCASNYSDEQINVITKIPSFTCKGSHYNPWELNYPAITLGFNGLEKSSKEFDVVISRTVTHICEEPSEYKAEVTSPEGVTVTVSPDVLTFNSKGEKQSFEVRISGSKKEVGKDMVTDVGKLVWSDGKHKVNSPIVVFHFTGSLLKN